MNGVSALKKRPPQSFLIPSTMRGYSEKVPAMNQEVFWTYFWNFGTTKNEFLLFIS